MTDVLNEWDRLVNLARQDRAPEFDVLHNVLATLTLSVETDKEEWDASNLYLAGVCAVAASIALVIAWPAWQATFNPWVSLTQQFMVGL